MWGSFTQTYMDLPTKIICLCLLSMRAQETMTGMTGDHPLWGGGGGGPSVTKSILIFTSSLDLLRHSIAGPEGGGEKARKRV